MVNSKKSQQEKFIHKSRGLKRDEEEAAFDDKLRKIAQPNKRQSKGGDEQG